MSASLLHLLLRQILQMLTQLARDGAPRTSSCSSCARPVLVAATVGDASADGRYLWWSTGDHEPVTWYGLALSRLR